MQSELKQFTERLLQVTRDSFNTYGVDSSFPNTDSTQRAIGYKLQKSALTFAAVYSKQSTSKAVLIRQAQEVEGYIRTGQALSSLSKNEADALVGALYNLMESRAQ